mmetsp:Transcript_9499/g.25333  ORF Transcript_9499/g.25333 Transcript_9499/m.25333 type:complete len:220 (+) Transcript_9499:2746-3405(+)
MTHRVVTGSALSSSIRSSLRSVMAPGRSCLFASTSSGTSSVKELVLFDLPASSSPRNNFRKWIWASGIRSMSEASTTNTIASAARAYRRHVSRTSIEPPTSKMSYFLPWYFRSSLLWPGVGVVMVNLFSRSWYRIVVFPDPSSPTMRMPRLPVLAFRAAYLSTYDLLTAPPIFPQRRTAGSTKRSRCVSRDSTPPPSHELLPSKLPKRARYPRCARQSG